MKPWIEKYRPTRINNIIGHKYIISTLKNVIVDNNIPHLLFYGPPGVGKTSTIISMARELFGPNNMKNRVLELNASDERGIGVVRTDILNFVKYKLSDPDPKYPSPRYKILILDEADAMTVDAQTALRMIMEEYSESTRFCIICNYIDKIIPPIISRCMQFKFLPIQDEIIKNHLMKISEIEKIKLDEDIYNTITDISNGDLRKAIGILQNIQYYKKITPNFSNETVCDMEGIISDKILEEFIQTTKNKTVKYTVDKFYYKGYSTKKICDKLVLKYMEDEEISMYITNLIYKLNKGSYDYIILYNLVNYLKNKI